MTRKENGPRKENGGAKASNVVRQSSVTSVTSVASSGHDDRPIVTEAARREQEAYHNERMAEAAQKQHKQLRQQQWEAESLHGWRVDHPEKKHTGAGEQIGSASLAGWWGRSTKPFPTSW